MSGSGMPAVSLKPSRLTHNKYAGWEEETAALSFFLYIDVFAGLISLSLSFYLLGQQ